MSPRAKQVAKPHRITPSLLRGWRLPKPEPDSDKEARGTVLVGGGSVEVPGGLILAGIAALRAGAGKLQLAAPTGIAREVAVSVVEARVVGLSATKSGALGATGGRELATLAKAADAVLIGPGMIDEQRAVSFTKECLRHAPDCPIVIDAACIGGLPAGKRISADAILTPHAGEMAALLGASKRDVEERPAGCALEAASGLNAVIVMKGSTTFIAAGNYLYSYDAGDVGLATSGSGDVLSGIIAGLLARGVPLDQAAVWGVAIHGAAGNALARNVGRIGFLARELLDEIPRAMLSGVLR